MLSTTQEIEIISSARQIRNLKTDRVQKRSEMGYLNQLIRRLSDLQQTEALNIYNKVIKGEIA